MTPADDHKLRGLFLDLMATVPRDQRDEVRQLVVSIAEVIDFNLLEYEPDPPEEPFMTLQAAATISLRHAADTLYAMSKSVETDGLSAGLKAKMEERSQ